MLNRLLGGDLDHMKEMRESWYTQHELDSMEQQQNRNMSQNCKITGGSTQKEYNLTRVIVQPEEEKTEPNTSSNRQPRRKQGTLRQN